MSEQTPDVSHETKTETIPAYKRDNSSLKFERIPVNPYAPQAHQNAQTIGSASNAMTANQPEDAQKTQEEEPISSETEKQETAEKDLTLDQAPTDKPKESRTAQELNRLAKEKAELRREKQQLEEMRKKYDAEPKLDMEEFKKLAAENPLELARKLGVDERELYNKYTQKILEGSESEEQSTIKKLQAQLSEFQNKFETKEQEDARIKAEQQISNFKNQITSHIDSNAEKYELVKTLNASDTVFEVIKQYHDQTQKLLSLDEASEIVETQLEEDLSSQLKILAKAKKIQKLGLLKEIQEESEAQEVNQASGLTEKINSKEPTSEDPAEAFARQRKMNRTITNSMVGQSRPNNRPMTREERMQEAAKILRNVSGT